MNITQQATTDTFAFLINAEGVIVDAQDRACVALGWPLEELINKPLSEILEYGYDLLRDHLNSGIIDASSEFSFSALVRRKEDGPFATTAIIRVLPELGCFTVDFDEFPAPTEAPIAEEIATFETSAENDESIVLPRDFQQAVEESSTNDSAETAPRFRNIFLSASTRTHAHKEEIQQMESPKETAVKEDLSTQLQAEREERRRLEGRVLSLNDQLQQLHSQLKNNLESETIYHKRVAECEEELRKAEQARVDAEVVLRDEQKRRERLENELAQLKAECAKQQKEREARDQEWLAKLASCLSELKDSDARLEKELATRRGIDVSLQMLQQDFRAHTSVHKHDK